MELFKLNKIYFLGIGGIGMSALARYFNAKGVKVSGYDKTSTFLTQELEKEGIDIHYFDNPDFIDNSIELIIYTPAIPKDLKEWGFALQMDCPLMKRSEILGLLTKDYFTIAVAGTHGKTSITSMIAHVLHYAGIDIIAFIGGVSKNYNSNLLLNQNSKVIVVEADEFDRSFLNLNPDVVVVSSIDSDHLDIYKTRDNLINTYYQFIENVKIGGKIFAKKFAFPKEPHGKEFQTYSIGEISDTIARNIKVENGDFIFDFKKADIEIKNLILCVPGRYNVENALAAIIVALSLNLDPNVIREALKVYTGVKRRFEYQIKRPDFVYIDDYAHHPEEIKALITAVKELYPRKKITGIFQPHLFTRTRDCMEGFAESLAMLDCLILLEIYPAREVPINGVNSDILLDMVKSNSKILVTKERALEIIKEEKPEVLLTIGAGDIDQLIMPILNYFNFL